MANEISNNVTIISVENMIYREYPTFDTKTTFETIDLLKVKLKNKQAAIDNLLDIIKIFTVNKTKKDGSREEQSIKVRSKGNVNDNIVRELLQIDQFYHH